MGLFRSKNQQRPPAAPSSGPAPVDGDSPAELRRALFTMNRFINQNSGRLPGAAVVGARRVTDTLREIIDTSDIRPLDVYAVITVKSTLNDYLLTTLRTYLAIDVNLRHTPRASGHTPSQSLLEQIDALQTAVDEILIAASNSNVDALMIQGNFLRTKYSASDLDL